MSEKEKSRVLIVDNSYGVRRVFAQSIQAMANVEIARNVVEADRIIRIFQNQLALIIIDGLEGGWREVATAANESGIPQENCVVVSGSPINSEVVSWGLRFIQKGPGIDEKIKRLVAGIQN